MYYYKCPLCSYISEPVEEQEEILLCHQCSCCLMLENEYTIAEDGEYRINEY